MQKHVHTYMANIELVIVASDAADVGARSAHATCIRLVGVERSAVRILSIVLLILLVAKQQITYKSCLLFSAGEYMLLGTFLPHIRTERERERGVENIGLFQPWSDGKW